MTIDDGASGQMSRRRFLRNVGIGAATIPVIGGVANAAATLPSWAGMKHYPKTARKSMNLAVASFTSMNYAPTQIAAQGGFFHNNGVDVAQTLISSGSSTLMNALVGGSVQAVLTSTNSVIEAIAQGQPVQCVAQVITGLGGGQIVFGHSYAASKGITGRSSAQAKLAALRGATVGSLSLTSGTVAVLTAYLLKNNFNPATDLTIVPNPSGSALLDSLLAGKIDALAYFPPTTNQAVLEGAAIPGLSFATDTSLSQMTFSSIVVEKSWAAANKQSLLRFVRALWKIDEYIQSSPNKARDLCAKYQASVGAPLPSNVFDAAWQTSFVSFSKTPLISQVGIQEVINSWINIIPPYSSNPLHMSFEQVATNEYVELSKP
jgi:NitT/TauT family transport system substrate-binding protein